MKPNADPDEPRDEQLAALYRAAAIETPSRAHDERILAAAARALVPPGSSRSPMSQSPMRPWWTRFRLPVTVAATVVVAASLTIAVRDQRNTPGPVLSAARAPVVPDKTADALSPLAENAPSSTPAPASPASAHLSSPAPSAAPYPTPRSQTLGASAAPTPPPRLEGPHASPRPEAFAKTTPPALPAELARSRAIEADSERRADTARVAGEPTAPLPFPESAAARSAPAAPAASVLPAPPPSVPLAAAPAAPAGAAPRASAAPSAQGELGQSAPGAQAEAQANPAARARAAPGGGPSPAERIEVIRTLLRQGRRSEARAALRDFRALYPNYLLPDDLLREP